jgi:hypothetical protein
LKFSPRFIHWLVWSFLLSGCISSNTEDSNNKLTAQKVNSSFKTIHDLRFNTPPGVLDTREFVGLNLSKEFLDSIPINSIVKIKDSSKIYFLGNLSDLKSNSKISLVKDSLKKNNSFTLEVKSSGKTIQAHKIKLRPGTYTKL